MTEHKPRTDAELLELMKTAMEHTFAAEDTSDKQRFINVNRVPLICQSIIQINKDMGDLKGSIKAIEDNLGWGVKIVLGVVIMGVMGLLFITKM